MKKSVQGVLQLQWGWITPGTGEANRCAQSDRHFAFLAEPVTPHRAHFLLTHCGWWLDAKATASVRDLTGRNPEPHRALTPCDASIARGLAAYVRRRRLDFVVYPYAAAVSEATTGEGLLRSFRFSREIAAGLFRKPLRAMVNHDFCYGLDWAAAQMPQIARLLGFDIVLAQCDAIVRGLDGTRVRTVGETFLADILREGVPRSIPCFHPMELTHSISFHRDSSAQKGISFRALTLAGYLRRAPARRALDAQSLGTKSWYGGVCDALLLEQNVKSAEVRLPAIEALAVLSGQARLPRLCAQIDDLWKKSFILMDNHTLWQCHNYKAHCLPKSAELLAEARHLEAQLLRQVKRSHAAIVFNPVPWTRDIVVEDGARTLLVKDVQGWSARAVPRTPAPVRTDADTRTLSNELVTYTLNARGEAVSVRTKDGVRRFAGLGRLVRIHEDGKRKRLALRRGATLKIEGSLSASAEVDLSDMPAESVALEVADLAGAAFLLQAERLDGSGRNLGTEWRKLHILHWGGPGLPRHAMKIEPQWVNAHGAARVRFTLWMLAEGRVRFGRARILTGTETRREITEWAITVHYRNAYSGTSNVKARVARSDAAMKTVRFSGALPGARFVMDVSLRQGSPVLEYDLRLRFPRPTPLGLTSPPFRPEDGSILGAQCERPYVPGVAVLFPLSRGARYFADKPFHIQEMLIPSPRTWHTDVRDWWLGMSPFIGMNLAAADMGRTQFGLLTRGAKHFFRWRRGRTESLGLSLGATLIHPMTQGHSVPPSCPVHDLVKRADHDPYIETSFLHARGDYRFHYAVCPAAGGETARFALWRRAQEFALPAQVTGTELTRGTQIPGITCEPAEVVATALEARAGRRILRLVNMRNRPVRATITLSFPASASGVADDDSSVAASGNQFRLQLKPWAVREIEIAEHCRSKRADARERTSPHGGR